jgi:hypothetical protein
MSTQLVLGGLEETGQGTFGGILASDGVKRDGDSWAIDGIDCTEFLENPYIDLEHEGPPCGIVDRLGKVTLSNGARALAISCRWGPLEIPAIAEAQARVRARLYNTFSAAIDPIECEPIRGTRGVRVLKSTLLGASIVKLPADAQARITQRSCRGNAVLMRALPRVPARALERAMARIERGHQEQRHVPIGLMRDYELAAFYREQHAQRTLAVSLVGFANTVERRDQRQEDLEKLRRIGRGY